VRRDLYEKKMRWHFSR